MTVDWDIARFIEEKVREDDARVGFRPDTPIMAAPSFAVAWLIARHPLLGGEYYRATRPAMLTSSRYGWHTAVCDRLATEEGDDDGPLVGLTPGLTPHPIRPDVLIVRPIREMTRDLVHQAQQHGQIVIADLDDDIWAHEDWTPDTRPDDDHYEEWCYEVDAWLVSTPQIRDRVLERYAGHNLPAPPVLIAPNCFDPRGFGAHPGPRPGRRIGTRLWLSGRMHADLEIYRTCFAPLLSRLDLEFVHIGYEARDEVSFAQDCGMPADRVHLIGSVPLTEMGRWLAATISVGTIALGRHAYNRAKTLTHAVELASAGLPLVIADALDHYHGVPGQVQAEPHAVERRVRRLVNDRGYWARESLRARTWAVEHAVTCEQDYLTSLEMLITSMCSV